MSYYIPNRLTDGYGLNVDRIREFKEMGFSLIITVDTGIVAFEEAKFAKEIGIDLVITDHHELQDDKIPDAVAVVNPKRKDCTYSFKDIAGCFVAYKVVQALAINLGIDEEEIKHYLELVAIGTIADVMPLVNENRYAVLEGIESMKNTNNMGIKKLIEKLPELTAENIAFYVVPKLNAPRKTSEKIQLLHFF